MRPITMSEAVVRLVSICALACVPDAGALSTLGPYQIGAGIQGAAGVLRHARHRRPQRWDVIYRPVYL